MSGQHKLTTSIAGNIKVLIIDDSALMRMMIGNILSGDKKIKIIGSAQTGLEAIEKVRQLRPDVVTMDIEMPGIDGIKALRVIMRDTPTRIVVLSGADRPEPAYEALRFGAVDFMSKPSGPISYNLKTIGAELLHKIHAAAHADLKNLTTAYKTDKTAIKQVKRPTTIFAKVVAIGSSTGGPQALEQVFSRLAPDFPAAILIVQHLPSGYSHALAERLTRIGHIPVKEAADGDPIKIGRALLAPADRHMIASRTPENNFFVRLEMSPPVNHVRPSVDKLMLSVAETYGKRSVGVIMTGMGVDGVTGMEGIKRVGGRTIVQNKNTSVVFGMPGAAIERGLADRIMPISQMAAAVENAIGDN